MIRIVIVEDDVFLLNSLQLVLKSNDKIEVIGTFHHPALAIKEIPILNPDIVLMDLDLGRNEINGIDCIIAIKEKSPHILFLILTIYEDHDKVFQALSAGALGYILKSSGKEKMIDAIYDLYEGGSPMSPSIARKIAASFNQKTATNTLYTDILTNREKEVLDWISKGKIEKEVASELYISIKTVKNHITNIYAKLQVNTRVEALNKYYSKDKNNH
ncbi:MAG: response regulator transcription factor [Saprospiraceae bacterium]|nr:response regulator transcription factor [Saprospiraceae bacterium]MBP6567305.1 response regulator transcription factor [Saprospiraceae bacterium]